MSKPLAELKPGDRVCVVGRGMDSMIHHHETVLRITKTLLVTQNSNGNASGRFRLDTTQSVPYSPYGGAYVHTTCQRRGQVQR